MDGLVFNGFTQPYERKSQKDSEKGSPEGAPQFAVGARQFVAPQFVVGAPESVVGAPQSSPQPPDDDDTKKGNGECCFMRNKLYIPTICCILSLCIILPMSQYSLLSAPLVDRSCFDPSANPCIQIASVEDEAQRRGAFSKMKLPTPVCRNGTYVYFNDNYNPFVRGPSVDRSFLMEPFRTDDTGPYWEPNLKMLQFSRTDYVRVAGCCVYESKIFGKGGWRPALRSDVERGSAEPSDEFTLELCDPNATIG
eukprot:gnl/MRDRNA2_/MRDRNA2_349058_c0_seq1.p1 gnl/MRDRNA2_/MRDRNA2_349058_c0~~gnl/MRDRNA2_/MRDRNA2_349058_c0_seq1.p1  ORF type:complete len:252 (-),score=21.53 gnl/MRDRNA2_/MRDRNA2_349058_c0_seq1:22-777(-)